MQPHRITLTKLPALERTISTTSKPNMSCLTMYPRPAARHTIRPFGFAPRGFPFAEVDSLFSLLDSATQPSSHRQRTFQPRFDVRETETSYQLQGELPGLRQQDVQVEWADGNTLTLHGKVVRESQRGDPSLAEGPTAQGALAEQNAAEPATKDTASETTTATKDTAHQPTVEDEGDEAATSTAAATPATTAADEKAEAPKPEQQPKEKRARYWVSERSTGEFHRAFTFSGHVDHGAVKASLKDGLLSIEVPKVQPKEPRRIQIE